MYMILPCCPSPGLTVSVRAKGTPSRPGARDHKHDPNRNAPVLVRNKTICCYILVRNTVLNSQCCPTNAAFGACPDIVFFLKEILGKCWDGREPSHNGKWRTLPHMPRGLCWRQKHATPLPALMSTPHDANPQDCDCQDAANAVRPWFFSFAGTVEVTKCWQTFLGS